MIISIENVFAPYAAAALTRLRYLHPSLTFTADAKSIRIEGITEGAEDKLRRDVAYQFYREKIYQDGLPMREAMYEAVLK